MLYCKPFSAKSAGLLEVSVYTQIYEIWSDRSEPFMQALMSFHSFGLLLAPLIMEPFLKKKFRSVDESLSDLDLIASSNSNLTESPLNNNFLNNIYSNNDKIDDLLKLSNYEYRI